MNVLVIGGSVFVGRAVVGAALAAGATVTVFNRGSSGPPPDGVTHVRGDRSERADLEQLTGRTFDLVIDTCGYEPADARLSAEVLEPNVGYYAFVSSINAFPGWPEQHPYQASGSYDGDPDLARGELPDGVGAEQAYGWRKVGCERAVTRAFGDARRTILRGGCIVGPDDSAVGRLPWWIARVARGGEVLVPGRPDDPVALIDARDLADFALARVPGVFEAAGPPHHTRADLMTACLRATGADATFTYVDDAWLDRQDVEAWTEIPLWVSAAQAPGLFRHDTASAEAAGLRWRSLEQTVADTWAWQESVDGGWQPTTRTPGLAADRERQLLSAWRG